MVGSLFNDNWYLLSDKSFALPFHIRVIPENRGDKRDFTLYDPYRNSFYRVSQESWEFLRELDLNTSLDDLWQGFVKRAPLNTPGQTEVINLLSRLNHENMLICSQPGTLDAVFERIRADKKKMVISKILNFMFIPVPLWDPDGFLKKISGLGRAVFSLSGFFVWAAVILSGLYFGITSFSDIYDAGSAALANENLVWLYLCWAILKFFHELSHAMACRAYGCEVHTMGIMLIAFAPVPYMDATSAWKIRSPLKRAIVGGAGIFAELFFAAIAAVIWANTSGGPVHSISFNIMFIGSVSTLAFNLNPLLRLDGYYILSDLLKIPNLHDRSTRYLKGLLKGFFLGIRQEAIIAETVFQKAFFPLFAAASGVYRFLVLMVISAFISTRFYTLGMFLSIMALIFWVCVPFLKLCAYLLFDKQVLRIFPRGLLIFLFFLFLIYFFMAIFTVDSSFVCRGVIDNRAGKSVVVPESGLISKMHVSSGGYVKKGMLLFELENRELEYERDRVFYGLEKNKIRLNQSQNHEKYFLTSLGQSKNSLEKQMLRIEQKLENLKVRAPETGIFYAPDFKQYENAHIIKGRQAGLILKERQACFHAVVTQEQAFRLFSSQKCTAKVRLAGTGQKLFPASIISISQAEKTILPHVSLGKSGGGIIDIDPLDPAGLKTRVPYFSVLLELAGNENNSLYPGHMHRGRVRFCFGKESLFSLLKTRLLQTVQKRYRF
jgi:putative peptide zinc metalloprotease protein